jgi:hypothetical protein
MRGGGDAGGGEDVDEDGVDAVCFFDSFFFPGSS